MQLLLFVGLGGFCGAVLRHLTGRAAVRWSGLEAHHATLLVNCLGCLVIGALLTLVTEAERLSPAARHFWIVGLLGSFTTYSTFGWEAFSLLRGEELLRGLLHIGLHLGLGLGMVAVGVVLGRASL